MKLAPIHLVIFEGPSGSGKTTLIKAATETYPLDYKFIDTSDRISRPRAYTDYQGIALSQAKDEYGFLLAVEEWFRSLPDAPSPIWPILDRFLLSQWVYGTMRDNRIELDPLEGISIIHSAMGWMQASLQSFAARGLYPYSIRSELINVPIYLHFIFVLPDVDTLEKNREAQTRGLEKYPYSTVHEISMYSTAVGIIDHRIKDQDKEEGSLHFNYRILTGDREEMKEECLSWLGALKSHPKR